MITVQTSTSYESTPAPCAYGGFQPTLIVALVFASSVGAVHASGSPWVCASFQAAVVDVLVAKSRIALRQTGLRRLHVVGGVAANRGLRNALEALWGKGSATWTSHAVPDPTETPPEEL